MNYGDYGSRRGDEFFIIESIKTKADCEYIKSVCNEIISEINMALENGPRPLTNPVNIIELSLIEKPNMLFDMTIYINSSCKVMHMIRDALADRIFAR